MPADAPPSAPTDTLPPVAPQTPTDAAPVEQPPAPPADVAPPAPPPSLNSWEALHKRATELDPEFGAALKRVHGGEREPKAGEIRAIRDAVMSEPPPNPASALAALMTPLQRRLAGVEEGDAWEGVEVKRPEPRKWEEIIDEPPEEALTDKSALRSWLAQAMGKARDALLDDADAITRARMEAASRDAFRPHIEAQRALTEAEAQAKAVNEAVAVLQKLPGMADKSAFDTVYEEMVKRGEGGQQAFKAVYAEMLADHPEWTSARPAAPREPEVVVRAAPAAPPDPLADAARLSRAFSGPRGTVPGRIQPPVPKEGTERLRALANNVELQQMLNDPNDDRPDYVKFRDARRRIGA